MDSDEFTLLLVIAIVVFLFSFASFALGHNSGYSEVVNLVESNFTIEQIKQLNN